MHQGLRQSQLLLVPLRQSADRHRRVELQALQQLAAILRVALLRPEGIDEVEEGAAAHPLVHAQVAGEIAAATPHLYGVAPAVESEDARCAGRGPDEVEENADGRRLAGAVRAQEAEDLAGVDGEVDAAKRAHASVVLEDGAQVDGGGHAVPPGAPRLTGRP